MLVGDLRLGAARVLFTQAGPGDDPLRGNFALNVRDDAGTVHRRRALLSAEVGRSLVWMEQTHSARVEVLTAEDASRWTGPEWGPVDADGVVVDAREWADAPAPAVLVADCLPVLLATSDASMVAAVHAGRRGLHNGIIAECVERMIERRGRRAHLELRAIIGPAICGSCYEVPADLRDRMALTHAGAASRTSWGTPALDLPRAAREELLALGVTVDVRAWPCTREDTRLHSYRRDPSCGRQAAVVSPGPTSDMPGASGGRFVAVHYGDTTGS